MGQLQSPCCSQDHGRASGLPFIFTLVKHPRAEASREGQQGQLMCAWCPWGLVDCWDREKCDVAPGLGGARQVTRSHPPQPTDSSLGQSVFHLQRCSGATQQPKRAAAASSARVYREWWSGMEQPFIPRAQSLLFFFLSAVGKLRPEFRSTGGDHTRRRWLLLSLWGSHAELLPIPC